MLDAGWWVTQVTTVLVAAMGVAVLIVKPRTTPSRALAWLLITYGVGVLSLNLAWLLITYGGGILSLNLAREEFFIAGYASVIFGAGAITSAAVLVIAYPRLARVHARAIPAIFTLMTLLGVLVSIPYSDQDAFAGLAASEMLLVRASLIALGGSITAILGVAAGLAYHYRAVAGGPGGDATRRQIALMAAGLVIPSAFTIASVFIAPAEGILVSLGAALVIALAMGAWLWAAHGDHGPRSARAIVWLIGIVALVGMAQRVAGFDPNATGAYGVARLIAFAILAYGLLSGQLLGLDVKVRFAVSKSTIAAIFIAVFFVASEGAQQFFGEAVGSEYLGILAAGALVFAIAPLQRLADHVAHKAVPHTGGSVTLRPTGARGDDSSGAYRAALRDNLGNGKVSRREEMLLARLAEALNVDPATALRIRYEVEDETGARASAGEGPASRGP